MLKDPRKNPNADNERTKCYLFDARMNRVHKIISFSAIVPAVTVLYPKVAEAKSTTSLIPLVSIPFNSGILYATQPTTKVPVKDLATGLWPLIELLQDFAFPVGVGIAVWGLIEVMLDNPKGKDRVKQAFVCYIGIFVIPYLFVVIKNAFQGLAIQP